MKNKYTQYSKVSKDEILNMKNAKLNKRNKILNYLKYFISLCLIFISYFLIMIYILFPMGMPNVIIFSVPLLLITIVLGAFVLGKLSNLYVTR